MDGKRTRNRLNKILFFRPLFSVFSVLVTPLYFVIKKIFKFSNFIKSSICCVVVNINEKKIGNTKKMTIYSAVINNVLEKKVIIYVRRTTVDARCRKLCVCVCNFIPSNIIKNKLFIFIYSVEEIKSYNL